jgi:SpoVK/Ycf46/Vps4 family AAA+-type ATPase
MQCSQCNLENRNNAKFCKQCGTTITAQNTVSPSGATVDVLDDLVGLDDLKKDLQDLQSILEGMKQNNAGTRYPYDTIIIGASGTAKTLISSLIAALFLKVGMINKGKPETVDGGSLESMPAKDLDKLFTNAKGGMLFVDNAQKLVDTDGKILPGFSRFIDVMERYENDPIVLMAGLPSGLREIFQNSSDPTNQQIINRFEKIFIIPDYTPDQYVAITESILKKQGFSFSDEFSEKFLQRFRYLFKELKKPDSKVKSVNGYLAIKEAQSVTNSYYLRKASDKIVLPEDIKGEIEEKKTLQEILAELENIIGMTELKKEIKSLYTQLNQAAEMEKKGVKVEKPAQHFVITGNPGTGKTTVARLLGKIFEGLGLLGSGHVIEVDRSKLVAGYVGQTAPLTNSACDSATGGILFIDEVYTLKQNDSDSFGQECIDTLLKRMEDDRGKFMVVVAGYKKPMENFLTANEGLKSRFTKYFNLEDYNPDELAAIFASLSSKQQYIVPPDTRNKIVAFFKDRCARKTRDFANGREARNLMDEARKNQAERLSTADIASMSKEETLTFMPEDMPATTAEKMVSIEEALKDLNELVGLKSVKDAVVKIANTLQAQKLTGQTGNLNKHFVFMGNPGTGKTTVARIMGDVFKSVGMLPTNNVIEADRGKLVASYVGQTAKLVQQQCDDSMGGILFIDEAYALKQGPQDSFGQEAVDTLLKRMEDDRGKFVVIAAGYTKEMDDFLASNSGFKSRFSDYINFDDYSTSEMRKIFIGMCKKSKIEFAEGFDEALQEKLEDMYAGRDSQFANARAVRILYDKIYENVSTRVMAMKGAGASDDDMKREIYIMRPEDLDMTVS